MCSNEVYKNYIEGIDLNNIKYINLTNDELMKFYIDNYYDIKVECLRKLMMILLDFLVPLVCIILILKVCLG